MPTALPLAGKPRSRRGGGGDAPLVGLAGQSLEARGGGEDQAGGRACGAAERAASRRAGPTPERPGASAQLESERTSKHHPRPASPAPRRGASSCASPGRPPLGLRAGTPRATDLPRVRAQPLPVVRTAMTHFNKGPSYGLSAEVKNKVHARARGRAG